jgi:hypothetical protein
VPPQPYEPEGVPDEECPQHRSRHYAARGRRVERRGCGQRWARQGLISRIDHAPS